MVFPCLPFKKKIEKSLLSSPLGFPSFMWLASLWKSGLEYWTGPAGWAYQTANYWKGMLKAKRVKLYLSYFQKGSFWFSFTFPFVLPFRAASSWSLGLLVAKMSCRRWRCLMRLALLSIFPTLLLAIISWRPWRWGDH